MIRSSMEKRLFQKGQRSEKETKGQSERERERMREGKGRREGHIHTQTLQASPDLRASKMQVNATANDSCITKRTV